MGISDDIKQAKFRSSHQKAALNIFYTNNWLYEKLRGLFIQEDLTNQQYNVLRILRGSYPQPLSTLQIRERMLDKMSDTSRIVDRLIKKKLVSKSTCETDKRLVDIHITNDGLELLKRLDSTEIKIDSYLSNLNAAEAEMLSKLLDKIREGNS